MSTGYELHQKLRTKTVRQVKKKQYDEAISTLHQGALDLLSQSEQGSGCDLAVYMIDVYGIKDQPVDSEARDRITDILAKAAPDFWRKKVVDAAVKWSIKASGASTGDPLLRLFVAKLYAKEGDYEHAEAHFLASCVETDKTYAVESAPKAYAQAMAEWLAKFAKQASEQEGEKGEADAIQRIEAGRFALRATVPLLANHAVKQALAFQQVYLTTVTASLKSLLLPVTPNPRPYVPPGSPATPASTTELQLYLTANADLNFSQMAVALVSESAKHSPQRVPDWLRNAWINLVRQYEREAPALTQEDGIRAAIPQIGADWFGLQQPRNQGNMLSDMIASLFGGPSGAGAGGAAAEKKDQPAQIKGAEAPPKPLSAPAAETTAGAAQRQAAPAAAVAEDLVDDEMD
ncbi:related to GET4-protein with a role in insertion of tail-anchored proteins into the ER membrane [Sporisorium scitamineum]|uniref:Related to GET4-protein with a role in insertion of tail-anchored proteins into the ER membrane n=1 Tax=Sporisorium scitamineum TaxID=49012 RepID=A0A140KM55_9BASI|nr:related to GET4-protein with a role in insertion of tail-anchored proteins into the ER membrane [Sporisorium scitamineum]